MSLYSLDTWFNYLYSGVWLTATPLQTLGNMGL
jgi:hypothetical protein